MQVSRDDFVGWKMNAITKKVMSMFRDLQEEAREQLLYAAHQGHVSHSAFLAGEIAAYYKLLNINFEDDLIEENSHEAAEMRGLSTSD